MSNDRTVLLAITLLLVLGVLACSFSVQTGASSKPTVEILSPPSGSRFEPGADVAVEYRATDGVAFGPWSEASRRPRPRA